jgi:hypothetical protein
MAALLHHGDLVVAVWEKTQPAFIEKLRVAARAREIEGKKIQIRTIQKALVSVPAIDSLTRSFQADPVSVSPLEEAADLELRFNGARIKLNRAELVSNGINPLQVIALIRQLSDYPPEKRKELFDKAGFTENREGGFWEVGSAFAARLEAIYKEQIAEAAIAKAA